ncbi:platelet-activating factor receptor-like [Myxocyprinus asiaticus]|uniref:platelet-activating factor receptor-like n=1 Tax=Myxocyprinus asiaticus TaxID=70543 RepID=UPI002221C635|nr:platelet-activating factor receptor-like [Myxocyprinus asiaticus]
MVNCTVYVTDPILNLQKATSIPTFILGMLGNIYVLLMFCRRPRSEWNYMKIYITNMAIADCVVLVILPIKIHYYNIPWTYPKGVCNFLLSVYYVNIYVSIFTMTAISVVRFVAIKYPMKAREILCCRNALVVCVLIWIVICSFSTFYFVKDSDNDKTMCFQRTKEGLSLLFILLLIMVGFLLPFLIMLFCTIKIIYTLRKQLEIGSRCEKIQCIFIISANLIVFVICFFPIHFGYLFKYMAKDHSCDVQFIAHNFLHGAFCISNMNCGLDSFSYYFATKTSWDMCCMNQTRKEGNECDYTSPPNLKRNS